MTLSLDRTCNILLEECAHIRRGEEVLVVADDLQAPELSAAISSAASKLSAHAVSIVYPAVPGWGQIFILDFALPFW